MAGVENGLRQIYKEMIYDAFDALGVEMPKDMEVHFAGSLAKHKPLSIVIWMPLLLLKMTKI